MHVDTTFYSALIRRSCTQKAVVLILQRVHWLDGKKGVVCPRSGFIGSSSK